MSLEYTVQDDIESTIEYKYNRQYTMDNNTIEYNRKYNRSTLTLLEPISFLITRFVPILAHVELPNTNDMFNNLFNYPIRRRAKIAFLLKLLLRFDSLKYLLLKGLIS